VKHRETVQQFYAAPNGGLRKSRTRAVYMIDIRITCSRANADFLLFMGTKKVQTSGRFNSQTLIITETI